MILSKRLKKVLTSKCINAKTLSDLSGVPEPTISRYINGARVPSSDILVKIALALNVSTDYLLGIDSLYFEDKPLNASMLDFWNFAFSDLSKETTRSQFAKFLINLALHPEGPIYDLKLTSPKGLSIASIVSAYYQTLDEDYPEQITFKLPNEKKDLYIFSLYTALTITSPSDVSNWLFYVLPLSAIRKLKTGSIPLSSLKPLCSPVKFPDLLEEIVKSETA